MVGSYFLSIISIYFLLNNFYINEIIKFSFSTIIFALLISSVSQLGDIIVSYFKRHSKIKDTVKIFGGYDVEADGSIHFSERSVFPTSCVLKMTKIHS